MDSRSSGLESCPERAFTNDLNGKSPMKRFVRPFITIGLGLILALLSAALTYSVPTSMQASFASGVFLSQTTATPPPQDRSEIGSTDGIIAMGFVIAVIIIVPILLQRKSWMEAP
jgi:hypothetical protein